MALLSSKGTITIGGLRISEDVIDETKGASLREIPVAYGSYDYYGTLTTRTSDSVGTLTFEDTPGNSPVATGEVVDLYFGLGTRFGVTIGTVAGNVAPFSGGSGDALPVAMTQILARKPEVHDISFPQDTAAAIAFAYANKDTDRTNVIYGVGRATVRLLTSSDVEIMRRTIEEGYVYRWTAGSGDDDPTAGQQVAKLSISHNYGLAPLSQKTIHVGIAYN